MNLTNDSSVVEELDDASLVMSSREGDRQAFGRIVSRYQRLLCSLAYSALGSLSESEDVAQEAFLEAWKKLGNLREPEKLKSWLCGILRFKISHHRRKEARQPVRQAAELQESTELESNDEAIEDVTMREEEQALLWRALEAVPETYRETLILYYREHRSIEHVACELDLSEDAVKQRLSRGRKLLQEKMMAYVEGALTRSTPGPVFTAGVMAALVSAAPPAQAAGASATAVKVGATFKWATIAAFLASASGFVSTFFALRANLDQARTQRERRAVVQTVAIFMAVCLGFVFALVGLRQAALGYAEMTGVIAAFTQVFILVFVLGFVVMTNRLLRRSRRLRASEKARRPDLFDSPDGNVRGKRREFLSSTKLLGVPLVHAKFDLAEEGEKPAFGWIAAGDRAYGLLFAWGGIAVAPISVGIVSCGLVTAGTIGFGVFGMGMVGVGLLSLGAVGIGLKAYASLSALGWQSAFSNGFSIAKGAAVGPIAFAEQVNNESAASLANLALADQSSGVILGTLALLVIVPVVWYSRVVRKNMADESAGIARAD